MSRISTNLKVVKDDIAARLLAAAYTASDVLAKLKTVHGAGSGLDADLVDGIHGYNLLRADVDDTCNGQITHKGMVQLSRVGHSLKAQMGYDSAPGETPYMALYTGQIYRGYLMVRDDRIRLVNYNGAMLDLLGAGEVQVNGNRVVHSGIAPGSKGDICTLTLDYNQPNPSFGQEVSGAVLRYADTDGHTGGRPSGTWSLRGFCRGDAGDPSERTSTWRRTDG